MTIAFFLQCTVEKAIVISTTIIIAFFTVHCKKGSCHFNNLIDWKLYDCKQDFTSKSGEELTDT